MNEKLGLFMQICAISCVAVYCCHNVFLSDVKDIVEKPQAKQEITLSERKQNPDTIEKQEPKKPIVKVKPKVHPYDSMTFSEKRPINLDDIVSRDVRYGVSSKDIQITIVKASGKSIPRKELEKAVRMVFKKLPHIKTTDYGVALVVETIITESNGGACIVSPDKKDLGIAQIRISSAIDMMNWLDFKHPDVKSALMNFYDKGYNDSLYDNLKFNIPFSIAVCITEYWRKLGGNYNAQIKTLEQRAIIWKTVYNSPKGVGTVNKYIQRVKDYNV